MIQLEPRENFIIARQIDNPADTNTYYVRGFVRNATTDELLATVNLTDKGDQRFRGLWQVAADVSGQGFYITVCTKIYTDSGYTTESTDYGREEYQYLVQQRFNPALMGGGGASVDYKKIAQAIKDELKNFQLPKQITASEIEAVIEKHVEKIKFPEVKIPENKETDLSGVMSEIKNLADKVNGIDVPKLDLSPVTKFLKEMSKMIEELIRNSNRQNGSGHDATQKAVEGLQFKMKTVEGYLEKLSNGIPLKFVSPDSSGTPQNRKFKMKTVEG